VTISPLPRADGHPSRPLAIVGATVIDATGAPPLHDATIVIEQGRIVSVSPKRDWPDAAELLDAKGKFAVPGLMDANVHLVLDIPPLTMVRYEDRYDELAIEAAQLALANGVTSVFDTWGPREFLIRAREAVLQGRQAGARIFLAGNIVGLGGPYSRDFFPLPQASLFEGFTGKINAIYEENVGARLLWMTPRQVEAEIRDYLRKGIDFLKYAATGHASGDMEFIAFSPRIQRMIVEQTHTAGKIAQSHTTNVEGLRIAVEAGVDLLQHADLTGPQPIPDETIELIVKRGTACSFLPNTRSNIDWYREKARATPDFMRYVVADENERALVSAGALVCLSTDGGVFCSNTCNSGLWQSHTPPEPNLLKLGKGHFYWLEAMEEKGMPALTALQAATRNIAQAYGVLDEIGTLEAGKIADIVLLDADPLQSAANYKRISHVIQSGNVIDRGALPSTRLLSEPGAE